MGEDKITKSVKNLYEAYSFPEHPEDHVYDEHFFDQFFKENIIAKLRSSTVLDAGCGTGPNIYPLSKSAKEVYAFDLSENSVKKAKRVIDKFNLKNVHITQGNIFEIPFNRKFDFIFSMGVLHHTKDARGGFKILANHLNSGGYITIALYNTFGSWKYRVLMRFFNMIKDEKKRIAFIKKYYDKNDDANIADSFLHPRVTFFSIDDVLDWFRENNIDFVSVSKPVRFRDIWSHYKNRAASPVQYKRVYTHLESKVKRVISQAIWGAHSNSGYFTIVGKKK